MWGALLGGAASLAGSLIGANAAKKAAKKTVPVPWSVFGPAGTSMVDKSGKKISLSMGDNPFAELFNQLGLDMFSRAGGAQDQFMFGADPELAAAYEGLFGQGLTDRISSQYDLLTQMAAPEEQRAFNRNADALFARTGLSTSGDADKMARFMEVQNQADLQRQLAAVGLGRQEALDRFTGASGAVSQGMGSALQNYNMGQGMFGGTQSLLQNLLQQAGLGVAAGGGQAPGAAMMAGQASMAPWQAANQFIQNSGLFNGFGGMGNTMYPGGGVPMVSQPNLGFPSVTPPAFFPMPQVQGL